MDNSNVFSWHFMFCLHWIAAHSITRLLFVAVIDFCYYDVSPYLALPLADCWSCIQCKCVCIFLISNSIGDLIMLFVVFSLYPFRVSHRWRQQNTTIKCNNRRVQRAKNLSCHSNHLLSRTVLRSNINIISLCVGSKCKCNRRSHCTWPAQVTKLPAHDPMRPRSLSICCIKVKYHKWSKTNVRYRNDTANYCSRLKHLSVCSRLVSKWTAVNSKQIRPKEFLCNSVKDEKSSKRDKR